MRLTCALESKLTAFSRKLAYELRTLAPTGANCSPNSSLQDEENKATDNSSKNKLFAFIFMYRLRFVCLVSPDNHVATVVGNLY